MSALSIPSTAAAALPAVNFHPHGHGHKKGAETDPFTDSSSTTAAQIPVGSAQNLFGNLLNTLEQVIGVQAPSLNTKPVSIDNTVAGPAGAGASTAAAGSKINLMA
jgi:hypothetical protein